MHVPVLQKEVLSVLAPQEGETVLDVTLGLGGHAMAFLELLGKEGRLIGIDADEENLALGGERLASWSDQTQLLHGNFANLPDLDLPQVDILFADLGLSSPHVDDPQRGFTFRVDAPLDMRYDRSQGATAADLLASSSQQEIADVLFQFGEVKQSRKIALSIHKAPPKTTEELKHCIEDVCGRFAASILPQVFQALRIAVNDEMGALDALLTHGPMLLKPGGRMGVISYHSLEDRMVKQVFRILSTPEKDPQTGADSAPAAFELLTRKPTMPSDEEQAENPRSRSAKFRAIRRITF